MKLTSSKIRILAYCAAVAVATAVGYDLGFINARKERDMLRHKIDELEKVSNEATVVKRISQQMEDIAFQQKAVSDAQRDKAEEQSQIAMQMRDRAEQESRTAYEAEQKAIQYARQAELSAKEAQAQHSRALESQRIAEAERDAATLAKNISDTLSMISLCQNLSSSAIFNYNQGNYDIALLQAYSSWYFKEKYNGGDAISFNALYTCSGTEKSTRIKSHAAVTGISMVNATTFVVVTDYGEIEYIDNFEKDGKLLFSDRSYEFKDVYTSDGRAFALSLHGQLCVVDPGRKVSELSLPEGLYRHVVRYDDNTAVLAGDNIIVFFDTDRCRILSSHKVSADISTLFVRKGKLYLFMKDGSYAQMSRDGRTESIEPIADDAIMYVMYDSDTDVVYMGCDEGHITILNLTDGHMTTLMGHTGAICNIGKVDNILYTCAYDKSINFSNLDETVTDDMNEQFISANQKFTSWPLASTRMNDTEIIVGFSDGTIRCINTSSSSIAASILEKMTRNFTEEEWRRYIGTLAPYTKFK